MKGEYLRLFCGIMLLVGKLANAQSLASGQGIPLSFSPEVLKWRKEGLTIQLSDQLRHPSFSWPLSVVQYRIDFGDQGVIAGDLVLSDKEKQAEIPFQLEAKVMKSGKVRKATLLFITDLPYKAEKHFQLFLRRQQQSFRSSELLTNPKTSKPNISDQKSACLNTSGANSGTVPDSSSLRLRKTASGYLLSNGKVRLEIPLSGKAAAPITRFGNAQLWLAYGKIPGLMSKAKMKVRLLSAGPVQAVTQISYHFPGKQRYTLTLKLSAAQEYVELEEQMTGFVSKEHLSWQLRWQGLYPDTRYASTRVGVKDPQQKGFANLIFEPMEGLPIVASADQHPYLPFDQQNDANGKLPFQISLYDNWLSWWRLPAVAFWSKTQNLSTGLFIKDAEKWNDGQYALWTSKPALNISFSWKDKLLSYHFPLVKGSRSTALAVYPHEKDILLINQQQSTAYIDELRRWQGWITLDKVKDWKLDYAIPEIGYPRFFKAADASEALSLRSLETQLSNNLKIIASGTERINGPNPVSSRIYYELIAPAFDLSASAMSCAEYSRLRAWLLFVSYLYQDEALMPMRNLLSGHPNFLADIKALPGLTAFLFPAHPQSAQMANHFEKSIQLNFHYHIRPDVPSWEARGGRWTENLATYTWAALKPTLRTNYLLQQSDGKNRLLQPGVSLLGNWLMNALTAPLQSLNNRRVYPPQGAHAMSHGTSPPNALRLLGQELVYYDPILAEKLLWLTRADDAPFESTAEKDKAWSAMLKGKWELNKGTNPHLRSQKYTGYGVVLRSGFGRPEEMYVHLQQIDEGPNYRWGRAAMGGNGLIYYYAAGKRYSHNGAEDVGDGPFGDVERVTNFGIKQAGGYRSLGPYRSVGTNDLTAPLYDFGFAQFATALGNSEVAAGYQSRSVLQSGSDYIVIFDQVADPNTEGRFSWFVGKDDDFPVIHQLRPGVNGADAAVVPTKSNYHKDPAVPPTKGRYYDGKGSFLTVVTHKPELSVSKTAFGCKVLKKNGDEDLIFRSEKNIDYEKEGIAFQGSAGIVQRLDKGQYAAAIFAGKHIAFPGLRLTVVDNSIKTSSASQSHTGISAVYDDYGFRGEIQCKTAQKIQFETPMAGLDFFLDGKSLPEMHGKLSIALSVPAGKHVWQWSAMGVQPQPPVIKALSLHNQGFRLSWANRMGATGYRIEYSKNGGESWEILIAHCQDTTANISGLKNESKIHIRIIAKGRSLDSAPSDEYPVYLTSMAPHAPEGLGLELSPSQIRLSWGTILGADVYQLFRREKLASGGADFQKIYEGNCRTFSDRQTSIKGMAKPNQQVSNDPLNHHGHIYEYAVKAVNGNGASVLSNLIDTDPGNFLNWQPKKGEGFRRDTQNHENGFQEFNPFVEEQMPILEYPGLKLNMADGRKPEFDSRTIKKN